MLLPDFVAHVVPPTVAYPPRIVVATRGEVVVMPVVASWVAGGSVESMTPPFARVIAPRFSSGGLGVAASGSSTAAEWPLLTAVEANVCALEVAAPEPLRRSVPPLKFAGLEALMMFVAGAPAAAKSRP